MSMLIPPASDIISCNNKGCVYYSDNSDSYCKECRISIERNWVCIFCGLIFS